MSADRLREAARVLRELAEAATPGPWEAWISQQAEPYVSEEGRAFFGLVAAPSHGRDDYGKADAAYIATMQPGVGLALADILDGLATNLPDWEPGRRAADLILGGAA